MERSAAEEFKEKRRTVPTFAFFCSLRNCSTSLMLTSLESTRMIEYCLVVSCLQARSKSSEPSTGKTPKFRSLNAKERTGKSVNGQHSTFQQIEETKKITHSSSRVSLNTPGAARTKALRESTANVGNR